jgi:hypothetical protein
MRLDPGKSSIRIRIFAEGLFARLAHDLELTTGPLEGSVDQDSARVAFTIEDMRVVGTIVGGRVNPDGLSASDRRDCLAKMRADVFHADKGPVEVVASRTRSGHIRLPSGRTVDLALSELNVEEARARGSASVSLRAIGSNVVKGPMNAFRIKDRVEVTFDLCFA